MLQTVTVPAFAAENTTENVEVATNDASTEEESTFNLIFRKNKYGYVIR